jgi:glycosyltransferase involved in cell wall biosynthesis
VKPKVLFLDHSGVLSGAELSLFDVASHYASCGRVLLFADGPFRERLEGSGITVEVRSVPRVVSEIRREGSGVRELQAMPSILKLSWQVARLARSYDILYTNSQKALIVGALAGTLARKPVMWHLRDILSKEHFSQRHRWLVANLANQTVARVIANSKATAAAFVQSGGKAHLVRVVYNGIDPTPFESVTQVEVDALRKNLGLMGVSIVGVFSRLAPWKGQHVLLDALARLPKVHALLVGDALFGERAYAESLRERARSLGITDRVHFLGFRRDVPKLMRLSDVVAHTSTAPEPFGRMIVEGMMAHRPVVASRAGGATEIIEDEANGALVPPGDPEALAKVLDDLLADPSGRTTLAKAGYEMALERFSLHSMLEGVDQQVTEVAKWRS